MHIDFAPGLTLVIGTNGLGKTTLVTMLFRLLSGPSDIRASSRSNDLGRGNLEVVNLSAREQRAFADRVRDRAQHASARLVFELGSHQVSVERGLGNMALRSFSVDGSAANRSEETFQQQIAALANVSSFSDWILLLRYIVFYFEDRRSLVWSLTAQSQLLRILFLEAEHARDWAERERDNGSGFWVSQPALCNYSRREEFR